MKEEVGEVAYFIDEGDIDMHRILRILKKNDFQGVLIPDHTPLITPPPGTRARPTRWGICGRRRRCMGKSECI